MTARDNKQTIGKRIATRGLRIAALAAVGATLLVGGCTVHESNHYRGRHGHGPGFHDRHDDRGGWDRRDRNYRDDRRR